MRDYMLQFCEDHLRTPQISKEMMKVTMFATQPQQQVFDYTFQAPKEEGDETNPNPASQKFSNGL